MSLKSYNFIQEDLSELFSQVKVENLDSLRGQHLCITGGAGFVGIWLSEMIHFLNEHHQYHTRVLIIDRDLEKIKKSSPHLFNSPLFSFRSEDVRNMLELPKDVSYIVHAAGQPDSRFHLSNPVDTMNSIAQGTDAVLRCSERLSHLRMFLNLSSSLVYGSFSERTENIKESDYHPMDEASVSSVYAVAKKYSETQTVAYKNQYRIPVCILRPFTFLGPYQPLQGPWAVNNFISDVLGGKSIKVLGDGETVRSFLYASDMAYWILNILARAESGEIYNLGSSVPTSIRELAAEVQANDSKVDVTYHAGSGTAQRRSRMVPDISRMQKKFDLRQTVSLQNAVSKTIKWHLLGAL